MSKIIYMLSDYDEHGAENVRMTDNINKLEDILKLMYDDYKKNRTDVNYINLLDNQFNEDLNNLRNYLNSFKEDEIIDVCDSGHQLSQGWGGIQLHIVKLI